MGIIKGYDNTIIDYADSTKKFQITGGKADSSVPIDMNNLKITGLALATDGADAASKDFVAAAMASGRTFDNVDCRLMALTAIGGTWAYDGVAGTLTRTSGTTVIGNVDSVAVNTTDTANDIICVAWNPNGDAKQNGFYTVTTNLAGSNAVLTRTPAWATGRVWNEDTQFGVELGTLYYDTLWVLHAGGTVGTDNFTIDQDGAGKGYVDAGDAAVVASSLQKTGGTMTGDLTISKASPALILNDTASSPANQTAKLYRSGTESGFVADVTMATNFGNMATINAGGFGKTASLPTITGTSFSILSVFSVPASSANIGMAINNGSGTNIPHLIEMQNSGGTTSRFIFAREVGGVSKYTSIIDNPLGYLGSNLVTIVCVFNQTTDSMTYSINGNPFVTANFSNTGYMGGSAAWGSEVFAIATRDLIATRTGVSYADVALVDGEVSIADSIWYYNGGSGQTTASIDGRTWDGGGTLIHHWDADETPGAQATLDDSIGTLDITAATGTFTVAAVPSTFTQVAYPFTVNPSSVPGIRSEQTNGDQYGYTAQIGREFMVEMFDEDTGTDILVAKFNKTLAEIKAATINLGYGANHKISSSGNIELFSGLHELTSAGDIKLFNEQHNVTQSSVNMFSGRHEFTSGEIKFFGASGSPQFSALPALGSFVWSDFAISTHTLTQTVSAFNTKGSNMAAAMNLSIARTNKMLADLVRRGDYQTLGS